MFSSWKTYQKARNTALLGYFWKGKKVLNDRMKLENNKATDLENSELRRERH